MHFISMKRRRSTVLVMVALREPGQSVVILWPDRSPDIDEISKFRGRLIIRTNLYFGGDESGHGCRAYDLASKPNIRGPGALPRTP